ncbi:MAG: YceI family protein [Lacibacter sp.]
MIKKIALVILLVTVFQFSRAQELQLTRNGQISFFSSTPVEDIRAVNNEVSSVLNTKTGTLQFVVLIKGFQFKKAAMQEHFNNENYMNSTLYPKAEFKGSMIDLSKINFSKEGNYPVTVEGNLTMHGVTNKIKTTGSVQVKAGKISAASKFNIKLQDYKISVPSIVSAKIADTIEITVSCNYDTYQPNK